MSAPLSAQPAPPTPPPASLPAARDAGEIWLGILYIAEQEQLVAGDRLPSVRTLAELLGVKSTQVRDALLQAQARGAVRIVPRRNDAKLPRPRRERGAETRRGAM